MRSVCRHLKLLNKNLIEYPILIAPKWVLTFKLMRDASYIAVEAVFGQRKYKMFHSIYYARNTFDAAQSNYIVTEKDMLALVYAFDKFISYLVGSQRTVYIDHALI